MALSINDVKSKPKKLYLSATATAHAVDDITSGKPCRVFDIGVAAKTSSGGSIIYVVDATAAVATDVATDAVVAMQANVNSSKVASVGGETGMRFDNGLSFYVLPTIATDTNTCAWVTYMIEES